MITEVAGQPPPMQAVPVTEEVVLYDLDYWVAHGKELMHALIYLQGIEQPVSYRPMEEGGPRPEPLVYSIDEVARLLNISRSHAYESVQRGQLPHIKLGARILIPRAALDRMLEAPASDS
jgi:excisionase family DNA binding protein